MHISASENSIRGLCPPPQAAQDVSLFACRTADNEGSVNLTPPVVCVLTNHLCKIILGLDII